MKEHTHRYTNTNPHSHPSLTLHVIPARPSSSLPHPSPSSLAINPFPASKHNYNPHFHPSLTLMSSSLPGHHHPYITLHFPLVTLHHSLTTLPFTLSLTFASSPLPGLHAAQAHLCRQVRVPTSLLPGAGEGGGGGGLLPAPHRHDAALLPQERQGPRVTVVVVADVS